ncbi:MAG: endo alpha-1,4 polygalactosaminidase [Treponema sp.]
MCKNKTYNKKTITTIILPLLVISLLCTSFTFKKDYGVFLGINTKDIEKLAPYATIVVEGEEFDQEHIQYFHSNKQKVIAYLNIGALEKYRTYYNNYKKFALGVYHDWPDERWMDVSKKQWQEFIINKAFEYHKKGFDGFFIDNTDVYYQYQKDEIYQGLVDILKGIQKYNTEILINGGDTFVARLIDEKQDVFDGVNQECVFTSIDFKHNKYREQSTKEHRYFLEYLAKVKAYNKKVYLLEYGATASIKEKIKNYCEENKFNYFISLDKSLTKEIDFSN